MALLKRILAVSLCVAFALLWRLPGLDLRPMHGDEANQAVRTGMLMDEGEYHYDPSDHHGPVMYFAALPFCRATAKSFAETNEWNFRLVPVAFSLLTLLMLALLPSIGKPRGERGGFGAAIVTMFLMAASPAMIYYSRFFIQETQLITFLTGMLLCGVWFARFGRDGRDERDVRDERDERDVRDGRDGADRLDGRPSGRRFVPFIFGAFAGLAIASKETAVISFAAAAVGLVAAFGFKWIWRKVTWRDWLLAAVGFFVVLILFFSSFCTYWRGLYDAVFSTASAYLHRATAVPEHQHPWNFYWKILFWFRYGKGPVWSEAAILLPALFVAIAAFRNWRASNLWRALGSEALAGECVGLVRFLTVYTLFTALVYSCIPYKTPWCGLSLLHGCILLAGIGFWVIARWAAAAVPRRGVRLAAYLLLAFAFCTILYRNGMQSYRACFKYPADPRNPYVYAHTGTDAMNLVSSIKEAASKLRGLDTPIAVAVPAADTWPLPWYLRAYRSVGYWASVADIPDAAEPSILVVAADQGDAAAERFGKGMQCNFYGIRPGTLLNLFVPEDEPLAGSDQQ